MTWALSHSARKHQGHAYLTNKTVGYLVHQSLIFYITSQSFSLVMQYSQKGVQGFVPLQRLIFYCPPKGIQSEERAVASIV